MLDLFNEGFPIREIARALRRGEKAIKIRLRGKGIDADNSIGVSNNEPV